MSEVPAAGSPVVDDRLGAIGDARRVGLFGGSFDPIHAGHLEPVRRARERLGLERVIYLPTARPPHKPKHHFAPAHARFCMVELALLDEEGLYASALELTLGRPAFTVETVEALRAGRPDVRFHLLLGSDSFAELASWRRWEDLVAQVRLAVLTRPGWELARLRGALPPALGRLADAGEIDFVAHPPVDLSATELRRILARGGEPPPGAVPTRVLDYIRKYSLYR
jgi:nicotinate-nucleotide adenylyltransferase